jgi:hypothetical protein
LSVDQLFGLLLPHTHHLSGFFLKAHPREQVRNPGVRRQFWIFIRWEALARTRRAGCAVRRRSIPDGRGGFTRAFSSCPGPANLAGPP